MIPKADTHDSTNYSTAEITCGIICGCLPALPAFATHVSDFKTRSKRNGYNGYQSTLTPQSPSTGRPTPKSPGTPLVLSPLPRNSSVYSTVKAVLPTTPRLKDGIGNRHHGWEELDELEYVAGDERYAVKEFVAGEPRSPSPILK